MEKGATTAMTAAITAVITRGYTGRFVCMSLVPFCVRTYL